MIIGMKSVVLATMLNDVTTNEEREILHLHESPECSLVFSLSPENEAHSCISHITSSGNPRELSGSCNAVCNICVM
jgi:hypothetical protein